MAKVTFFQGEAKPLPFRIKNRRTGRIQDLTGASFLLWCQQEEDPEPIIVKTNSDFDVSGAASGYVTTFIQAVETIQQPGIYPTQLRITTADTPPQIEKIPLEIEILEDVAPNDWNLEVVGIVSLEAFGDTFVSNI